MRPTGHLRPSRRHTTRTERKLVVALAAFGAVMLSAVVPRLAPAQSDASQPSAPNPWSLDAGKAQGDRAERSRYFSGCREARAAGAAPIYRGQPGYRPDMDGDDDGIACEPVPD